MNEPNVAKQVDLPVDEPATVEDARDRVVDEVGEDARRAPASWLRDAEVPKGGE
jgi:hypothetical protein